MDDTTRLLKSECENLILFKLINSKKIEGSDMVLRPSMNAINPWAAQLFLIVLFWNEKLQFFNMFSRELLSQVLLKKKYPAF